jgi:hypothetical protein
VYVPVAAASVIEWDAENADREPLGALFGMYFDMP